MSLNIYFAGSIRGGRDDVELYKKIVDYLQTFGKVLTEHVASDEAIESEVTKELTWTVYSNDTEVHDAHMVHMELAQEHMTDAQIHDRDLMWLGESQVLVAEVTQPSMGVGYEIGRAIAMNKKILCLFRENSGKHLSAMVRGAHNDKDFKVVDYTDIEQAKTSIKEFLAAHFNV